MGGIPRQQTVDTPRTYRTHPATSPSTPAFVNGKSFLQAGEDLIRRVPHKKEGNRQPTEAFHILGNSTMDCLSSQPEQECVVVRVCKNAGMVWLGLGMNSWWV